VAEKKSDEARCIGGKSQVAMWINVVLVDSNDIPFFLVVVHDGHYLLRSITAPEVFVRHGKTLLP